jgi:hypothetical protein
MTHRRRMLAVLIVALVGALGWSSIGTADPLAGSQGTDTSLPITDSAVTVPGRGPFSGLRVTVNQTRDLVNQAVSITWEGGTPTRAGPGRFAAHFLQIMQCWGDDDGTNPANPGPPPEQCAQGAVAGTFGGVPVGLYPPGLSLSRIVSRANWANFDPEGGAFDPRTGDVWRPFRAVDGNEVGVHVDPSFVPFVQGGNFWLNPYFNIITTNESGAARTGVNGRGAELFQVETGIQSSGLGCGQRTQRLSDGSRKVPQCWIVVVPRGAPAAENEGTPFGGERADQFGVYTSPLAPTAWQNRIAIPIEFNPVDTPCSLANVERRIAGTELALSAISSWQPVLCVGGSLPPYSFATLGDETARQLIVNPSPGAPGLAVVSRPVDPATVAESSPVVYAPLTLSGLTIGFNVERIPTPTAPPEAQLLSGVRVADLNLTPRLVAKLLTQSYTRAVTILQAPDYGWLGRNSQHLLVDPDFLQFNPEFQQLQTFDARAVSGLQLPAGNSDAAQLVWDWILADPEARQWLDGAPDQWGMTVNPVYSTDAEVNPSGIGLAPPAPSSFPKADPYCYQAPDRNGIKPPLLCGTDWMPYARGFDDAAAVTRRAFDGARIQENQFAESPDQAWSRGLPQALGRRSMLAMTDTSAATQFGLQMARLSRAGDNGANRAFIPPTPASVNAGLAAMAPGEAPSVLEPAFGELVDGAYPLTILSYAMVAPLSLDETARNEYAAFIEYAAGPGQVVGYEYGQLPQGYVPLPSDLQAQAVAAAGTVRSLQPPPPSTTVPPTTEPAATTTVPPAAPSVTLPSSPPTSPTFPTFPTFTDEFPPGPGFVPFPDSFVPPPGFPDSDLVDDESPEEDGDGEDEPDGTRPVTSEPPVGDEPPAPEVGPSALTPFMDLARSRMAVPMLGAMSLLSALGAMQVGRRPKRTLTAQASDVPVEPG